MTHDELRALALEARGVLEPVTTTSYAYARYMSATRPVDVLALLDEVARLRAALAEARDTIQSCAEHYEIMADDIGCDAGNPNGGSADACEHCAMYRSAAVLNETAQRLSRALEAPDAANPTAVLTLLDEVARQFQVMAELVRERDAAGDDLARLRAAARAFAEQRTEAALIALMDEVER